MQPNPTPHKLDIPDYREQSPEVRARFERIAQRPVIMKIDSLGKRFETANGEIDALVDINFQIRRRELICVIGPSGCGKSTLIRIIAGLETPSSGQMLLDGKPVHGPGADRCMVFQGYTLFPWLTVLENVMFGMRMNNTGSEHEALEWIELVGLSKFTHAYPNQLSGGMKQRVAIARALAIRPRVLLMDEPFGALDAQTRCQLQTYLLEIWRNVDLTILFITHDLEEAIYLADRIVVLGANPGHIQEIIEVPVPHPRTQEQFLSPEFLATKARLEELIHPQGKDQSAFKMPRMTQVGDDVF